MEDDCISEGKFCPLMPNSRAKNMDELEDFLESSVKGSSLIRQTVLSKCVQIIETDEDLNGDLHRKQLVSDIFSTLHGTVKAWSRLKISIALSHRCRPWA